VIAFSPVHVGRVSAKTVNVIVAIVYDTLNVIEIAAAHSFNESGDISIVIFT
jgi:hypothetical protein